MSDHQEKRTHVLVAALFSFQAFLASKACLPSVLSHLLICVSSLNRSEIDLFAIWFQTAHP